MTARGTHLAGILGINHENWNARECGFIFDKPPELAESPRTERLPLSPPNRRPESFQVFKDDCPLCLQGFGDNSFRDHVICMPFESPFFSGVFFKMPFRVLGSPLLKLAFKASRLFSRSIHCFARIKLAVGSGGDIGDAKVNPKSTFRSKRYAIRHLNADAKIKLIFIENKIGLAPDHAAMKLGIRAINNGDFESAINAQNAYSIQPKSKDARIINERRMFIKPMKRSLISPITFDDFANGTNGKLCAQAKLFSNFEIAKLVEIYLSEIMLLPGNIGNKITGFVKPLHRFYERALLFFGRNQFNFNRKFHANILAHIYQYVKEAALLPGLKTGVSAPEFL